jgi:hypothetical protein
MYMVYGTYGIWYKLYGGGSLHVSPFALSSNLAAIHSCSYYTTAAAAAAAAAAATLHCCCCYTLLLYSAIPPPPWLLSEHTQETSLYHSSAPNNT